MGITRRPSSGFSSASHHSGPPLLLHVHLDVGLRSINRNVFCQQLMLIGTLQKKICVEISLRKANYYSVSPSLRALSESHSVCQHIKGPE